MARLTWRLLGHIQKRMAEIYATYPEIKSADVADMLNTEFANDPFLGGELITATHVNKQMYEAKLAARLIARNPGSAVALAEQVESGAAPTAPANYVPRTVAITETERDEDGVTSRRLTTTYALRNTPQVPEYVPVETWDGGSLSAAVRHGKGERLTVIGGDTQFPHEDPIAWGLFLAFIRDVRPEHIVLSGDIVDFGKASRHAPKLERELIGGINADLAHSYGRLRELRSAAGEKAKISYCVGNHDANLDRTLAKLGGLMADVATLRPAGDPSADRLLSLRNMLRLDDLDIETSGRTWPDDRVILADDLVVFHGESARKGAGQSVRALLDKYKASSTVQGHCHRQAVVGEAIHGIRGEYGIRYGIETGMLCNTDGLGYTTAPDWQQGWAVISFPESGAHWVPELVTVHAGEIAWRGRTWQMEAEDAAE